MIWLSLPVHNTGQFSPVAGPGIDLMTDECKRYDWFSGFDMNLHSSAAAPVQEHRKLREACRKINKPYRIVKITRGDGFLYWHNIIRVDI